MIGFINAPVPVEKTLTLYKNYAALASDESIQKTIAALKKNGIDVFVFNTKEEVRKKVFEIIPEKAEVMDMSSVTLKTLEITEEINNSGKYEAVRNMFKSVDESTKRKLGYGAEYTIGSVHAVTENGEILIASATGSQLGAYAYGARKVIWIVGTQKIVKDFDEGVKRIYEYCLPLENERIKKQYNIESKVGKILTVYSEAPHRITLIFLKQKIGF